MVIGVSSISSVSKNQNLTKTVQKGQISHSQQVYQIQSFEAETHFTILVAS